MIYLDDTLPSETIPDELWVAIFYTLQNDAKLFVSAYKENAMKRAALCEGKAVVAKYKLEEIKTLSRKTKMRLRNEGQRETKEETPKKVRRIRKVRATK